MNPDSTLSSTLSQVRNPTGLLVSVRSLREAQVCLAHQISILDWKEPNSGALGAVQAAVLEEFFGWKAARADSGARQAGGLGRVRLSFAAGELMDQAESMVGNLKPEWLSEFSFIKIGLASASSDWRRRWTRIVDDLPAATSPVMVTYADVNVAESPAIRDCLEMAIEHPRCRTVLIDTFCKDRALFDWLTPSQLAEIRRELSSASMQLVCAGSIGPESVHQVMACAPDFIGVRGAVCEASREGDLSSAKLEALLALLCQMNQDHGCG